MHMIHQVNSLGYKAFPTNQDVLRVQCFLQKWWQQVRIVKPILAGATLDHELMLYFFFILLRRQRTVAVHIEETLIVPVFGV